MNEDETRRLLRWLQRELYLLGDEVDTEALAQRWADEEYERTETDRALADRYEAAVAAELAGVS